MLRSNLQIRELLLPALKGRDEMNTYTTIVVLICMLLYTIYAVWQILQFKRLASGIFGTTAVIAGSIGVYLIAPFIAVFILWVIKIVLAILIISVFLGILGIYQVVIIQFYFRIAYISFLESGDMMFYENNFYRTSDGSLDVEFLFVNLGRPIGWRAYILTDINYKIFSRLRSDNCTIVHRLTENNNEMIRKINNFVQMSRQTNSYLNNIRYICWSKAIYDLSDMREVAKTWSEITAYYIRNGGSFGSIQPVLKQRGVISL